VDQCPWCSQLLPAASRWLPLRLRPELGNCITQHAAGGALWVLEGLITYRLPAACHRADRRRLQRERWRPDAASCVSSAIAPAAFEPGSPWGRHAIQYARAAALGPCGVKLDRKSGMGQVVRAGFSLLARTCQHRPQRRRSASALDYAWDSRRAGAGPWRWLPHAGCHYRRAGDGRLEQLTGRCPCGWRFCKCQAPCGFRGASAWKRWPHWR